MKNYFYLLIFAFFGGLLTNSCTTTEYVDDGVDYDTYSVVLDINNVNFSYDQNDGYFISREFSSPLYNADVVLIYRQSGTTQDNSPVWQKIPRTLYLNGGDELDYDYDFSKYDIMIYAGGTYDLSTTPQYINNQTFRVVIVPASFGKNANVNYDDYESVIKYYNIDDKNVKQL